MNRNVTVSIFELIGTFAFGGIFMLLCLLARDVARAFARDRSDLVVPAAVMAPLGDEPEPSTATPEPVVEPALEPEPVAEPTPEPVVLAPTEIVVIQKPLPDLLPLPEPRRDEVPIYAQVPVRLPQYDSIDWRFGWKRPAVDFPTGSFPTVVLSDDIEGYQVSEVPPMQLPGFEVTARDRRGFNLTDADRRALADQLAEKKHRKADVDLEAGTVVVSS